MLSGISYPYSEKSLQLKKLKAVYKSSSHMDPLSSWSSLELLFGKYHTAVWTVKKCYLIKAPFGKLVRMCQKLNLSCTLLFKCATIHRIVYPCSTYIMQILYLVRIMFQWTVITLISNTIQVCIPLVYIVDILAIVPFIEDPCKIKMSLWMHGKCLNAAKDYTKPHASW